MMPREPISRSFWRWTLLFATKRSRRIAVALVFLLAVGEVAAWKSLRHEPEYKGRTITFWAEEFTQNRIGYQEVQTAIKDLGDPAALAFARAFLKAQPRRKPTLQSFYFVLRSRLPAWLARTLPFRDLRAEMMWNIENANERAKGISLLGAIGPDAKGAIPALRAHLSNPQMTNYVWEALKQIQPRTGTPGEGVDSVGPLLSNPKFRFAPSLSPATTP